MPYGAAVAIVFASGRRRSPSPLRRLQRVPGHNEQPCKSAVSPAVEPPSPLLFRHPLAPPPPKPCPGRRPELRSGELRPPQLPYMLRWLRKSPGYAPVPLVAAPMGCNTDAAASRGRRR